MGWYLGWCFIVHIRWGQVACKYSTMDSTTKGTMFAERSGVAMVFVSTEAVAVWVSAALRDGTEDGAAA